MSLHKLVELPGRRDARGALSFAQYHDHLPFMPRRIFLLYDLAAGAGRGGHAHLRQHQFLFMAAGGCTVTVDDGAQRTSVRLDRPSLALYAPPMLWLELDQFDIGAVAACLVSDVYDEADYVRDRAKFEALVSTR